MSRTPSRTQKRDFENDITVEPCVKETVFAFHCWVETCFWLNVDPELVPIPVDDANAILKKSEAHNRFIADASDNKTTHEPQPPHATDEENFISMVASLAGKTFESDSEKVHACPRPPLTKHSDAPLAVKAVRMDVKCGRSKWLALV